MKTSPSEPDGLRTRIKLAPLFNSNRSDTENFIWRDMWHMCIAHDFDSINEVEAQARQGNESAIAALEIFKVKMMIVTLS